MISDPRQRRDEVDDLAGPGVSRGSSRVRSGGLVDDITAEEMTTIIPFVDGDTDYDLSDYDFGYEAPPARLLPPPGHRPKRPPGPPSSWKGYYRPTHSEITQDILIPRARVRSVRA